MVDKLNSDKSDLELSSDYQRLSQEQASTKVDDFILAQAKKAVTSGPVSLNKKAKPVYLRWPALTSVAASLFVVAILVLQQYPPPGLDPAEVMPVQSAAPELKKQTRMAETFQAKQAPMPAQAPMVMADSMEAMVLAEYSGKLVQLDETHWVLRQEKGILSLQGELEVLTPYKGQQVTIHGSLTEQGDKLQVFEIKPNH